MIERKRGERKGNRERSWREKKKERKRREREENREMSWREKEREDDCLLKMRVVNDELNGRVDEKKMKS